MKKNTWLTHFLSGLIPLLIFFVISQFMGYLPFGNKTFQILDSYSQYPGFIMALKNFNFFSWNGALGINLFSSFSYYSFSPLNIFILLIKPSTYNYFFTTLTFLRIFLLGFSMSYYLKSKNIEKFYMILFSTIFALIGFTSAYYYQNIWIDSIILLPIVILGVEKILQGQKSTTFIITLTLSIINNFYIGYIIGLFSTIYFFSYLIKKDNKFKLTKRYIFSALLVITMCAIILVPTFYALMNGKIDVLKNTNFLGLTSDWKRIPFSLTSGSTLINSYQSEGLAQVYSSLFALGLSILYIFNKKIDLKEKLPALVILTIFILSFTYKFFNYAWHMFAQPIWWDSRFSFCYSFFLIKLASDYLKSNKYPDIKNKLLSSIIISSIILASAFYIFDNTLHLSYLNLIFVLISILLLNIIIFYFNSKKKIFFALLVLLELSINCYNNFRINTLNNNLTDNYSKVKSIENKIANLKHKDKSFYRIERMNPFLTNDGLYFNYPTTTSFNSINNTKPEEFLKNLGYFGRTATIMFDPKNAPNIDPFVLSILNIKYIDGHLDYFIPLENEIYENPYPLSVGFVVNDNIKKIKLESDDLNLDKISNNINNLASAMTDLETKLYINYDNENFKNKIYKEKMDKDYLIFVPVEIGQELQSQYDFDIFINGELQKDYNFYLNVKKGETLEIHNKSNSNKDLYFKLFDLQEYEKVMKNLEEQLLKVNQNSKYILDGTINVKNDNSLLYLSLAYQPGMKVFVDDKEVEIEKIFESLIGIRLNQGFHSIKISYIPKGFIEGLIITLIGFTITLIYLKKQE